MEILEASEPQDTFRRVFAALQLPYLSVDVDVLADQLTSNGLGGPTYCQLPLLGEGERREGVVGAWRGLLQRIDPPDPLIRIVLETPRMQERLAKIEPSSLAPPGDVPHFAIATVNDNLIWEEETIWPAAYSTLLKQLNVLAFHARRLAATIAARAMALEAGGYANENMDVIDQISRVMPTDVHFAFASLGAWVGGAVNVQYFASYAIAPQLRNSAYLSKCAEQMGYTRAQARQLRLGGVVPVPALIAMPLIKAQGSTVVFGGIPVNEFSMANPPAELERSDVNEAKRPYAGFLIDRHYRSVFLGRPLNGAGLYGSRNVLRDHYEDFYARRRPDDLLRCRQFSVPVYEISSVEEAQGIVSEIPIRDEVNGIFFRGQTGLYTLDRPSSIKKLLFANSCAIEPSLPTSASRHQYNYDPAHFAMRFFLEHHVVPELMYGREWRSEWRQATTDPELSIDYAMMALAQHYGLPSHGLDVTRSLDVAIWFASQKYISDGGLARYNALEPRQWPRKARGRTDSFCLSECLPSFGGIAAGLP